MNLSVRIILLSILALSAGPALADTRSEITSAVDYYAEVWNEGDIEALRGYYDSKFVLVTARGVQPLAQRLDDLNALSGAGEDRGELSYTGVQVKSLGEGHALAYGQMRLQFKDGSSIDSWFSTVYTKTPFGWKAILTHQ
jgi:hypothetical protein